MSALGQKQTCAAQKVMSLYPSKRTCAVQLGMSALEETTKHGIRVKGPKRERHKRTITIDDDLLALLLSLRERHLRLKAGVPNSTAVDLSLIKLPEQALMFPNPPALGELNFVTPRYGRPVTRAFKRRASRAGLPHSPLS